MRSKWMIAGVLAACAAWVVPQITNAQQWIVPEKTQRKSGPYPVYEPSAQTGSPAPTAPATAESGFRAVRFTGDEKTDTATLNDLAAKGWQYVGPLANGTVAFKRADPKPVVSGQDGAVSGLDGTRTKVSGEAGGVSADAGAESDTFTVTGNKWAYKSGNTVLHAGTFAIDATKNPKHFTFTVTEGANVGGVVSAIYKLDGDTFVYCACNAGPDSRPTDFTTKARDGRYLLTWKKAKK